MRTPTSLLPGYISPLTLSGLPEGTPLLLGLSGGADSRLLLHLLSLDERLRGSVIHVAHVHHGIRGEEADRDETFCRQLAETYGFPFHVCHADVPAIARASGESLESAARRVRYDYFSQLMQQYKVPLLLTAHNADDNLETVLFRLSRGSGLGGLGGIAPVRPFSEGQLVRPLLACSKADIVRVCQSEGLAYVTDSTNADLDISRNRIRAVVVPELAVLASHPERRVGTMCEGLREDEALLMSLTEDFLRTAAGEQGISVRALLDAPPSIAKRALLRLFAMALGERAYSGTAQMEARHIGRILSALREQDGKVAERVIAFCPGAMVAKVEAGCLRFVSAESLEMSGNMPSFQIPLMPGEHDYAVPGLRVKLIETKTASLLEDVKNVYNPFIQDTLSFDTIETVMQDGIVLRSRQPGDVILQGGIHRKIRKLQNEKGIPPNLRARIPLLACGEKILWAPFLSVCDGFPAKPSSRQGKWLLTIELSDI